MVGGEPMQLMHSQVLFTENVSTYQHYEAWNRRLEFCGKEIQNRDSEEERRTVIQFRLQMIEAIVSALPHSQCQVDQYQRSNT